MKYAIKVLQHKWYVFLAGVMTDAPLWRLIIHDWSKFMPCEYRHYRRKFILKIDDPDGWKSAWIHHQNTNPHHWEYWFDRTKQVWVEMPMWAVREMVADWMGASRAYSGFWPDSVETWPWAKDNLEKIHETVNAITSLKIDKVLIEVGLLK